VIPVFGILSPADCTASAEPGPALSLFGTASASDLGELSDTRLKDQRDITDLVRQSMFLLCQGVNRAVAVALFVLLVACLAPHVLPFSGPFGTSRYDTIIRQSRKDRLSNTSDCRSNGE
jgi:hypothetical protein